MRPDAVPFGLLRHSSMLLGVFLKPLRVLFELLGSLLGASWEPLGASWSFLGRSWAVLGRNCVVLGRLFGHLIFSLFFERFWEQKGCPKGRHLGSPNRAKIAQKKRCKFKSEKVTSWTRLGAILGRFPRRLGVKHIDFSCVFKRFREHSRF